MTKDVVINVTGRQFDVGDVSVETAAEGNYYLKNGKHYVLYEERVEDSEDVIKNRVKFCDGYFEMVKNGDLGIPVPDYVDENVSTKVVRIIQSYVGVVNKMVWRKF